jgi:hypothetical protein
MRVHFSIDYQILGFLVVIASNLFNRLFLIHKINFPKSNRIKNNIIF